MTRLSVNINKIATLRNARGGNNPNVIKAAIDCERFGAQGITVHPRPDERHIRYDDVIKLKEVITTEFNIEGYPDQRYMELVREVKVIRKYLPKQLSEGELQEEIQKIILEVGATSIKEMGQVMGYASKALVGKADGKSISVLVRKLLS